MAQSVGSVSVDVVPDASRFRRELDGKLKGLKANIGLEADVAQFRAQIEKATRVKALTVNVDADTKQLRSKVEAATRNKGLKVNVDADTAAAEAKLDAVARDRRVNVDVDVDKSAVDRLAMASSGATSNMRGLYVAIAALGPALVPVTAAVGGLVAALSAPLAAAGGGITAFAAGVIGNIQDVIGAQKDLKTAQTAATSAATAYTSAQNGVATAMDGVRNAQRGLADAQISSNRGIQSALESVAQARRDAARSEQSARAAVASAIQSANQSVSTAEGSLASAQDRARSAQESLNDARDAARQKLADYTAQLRGAALDESGARLAVRSAQQSLNEVLADPKATQLQIDLARQALKEARFNYTQSKKDRADLRKQAAEDRKAGIKGDEGVIDARNELADANREVRDAEREVARTRVQAEKDIAAARKGVVQARVDGAREVAKAEASVEQARVDGARAVAAAQAGVTSANRQLAAAQVAAAAAGSKVSEAQSDIAKAMGRLSDGPAQRFVGALDRAKTAWKQFLSATRGKALGVASAALGIFSDLLPKLAPLANAAADAVGDLLRKFGAFVRGGGADKVIDWLTKATGPAIRSLGTIFGNIAVGLGGLIAAFKPLGDALLGSLEKLTGRFAEFGKTADSNKGVKGFIAYVREVGPLVATFFGDLVTIVVRLGQALAPIGVVILKAFGFLASALKAIPTDALTVIAAGIMGIVVGMKALSIVAAISPFGLIVGGLVALGAALVIAYKKSETFRKIVNAAWRGIKKAAQVTWNWMKGTLWPGIKQVFGWIGARATWLWKNAIRPAFKAIWKFLKTELFPILRDLWHKVVKPVFKGIGTVIRDAWRNVIKPILRGAWWFIKNVLAPVFKWLWKHVVVPVFKGIGDAIEDIWSNIIKPALQGFIWFFDNVLSPAVRGIYKAFKWGLRKVGDAVQWAWKNLIKPALSPFKSFLDGIVDLIEKIKDGWNDIKDFNFVKDDKGGAKDFWFGNPFDGLATGGPVSGPGTSTSDSIPAMLSDGEYVINARSVGKYGRGLFDALNAGTARVGGARFASGGLVGRVAGSTGGGSGFRSLWRKEIRPVVERLIAALRSEGGSDYTPSPGTGGSVGGGSGRGLLKGFGNNPKRMLKGFSDGQKMLDGFVKGAKRWQTTTVGMQLAVGKSSKKIGKYWTRLRKNDLGKLDKSWGKSFSKEMPRRLRGFDSSTGRTVKRTGKRLSGFISGPVRATEKSWQKTMTTNLPKFTNTMDSKVRTTAKRTTKGLNAFSGVVRSDVPKAFRTGVDAIGGQWDRVRNATGKPVKFVVSTVLNKGLLAAFNKIAKFVDTDTIKKISLPKGFSRGGYTGDGGTHEPKGIVHGGEYVINKKSTKRIEKTNPGFLERLNETGIPGHAKGGFVNPDKRVYVDGEPLSAIHAAQLGLAQRLSRTPIHVMQGSWQPATDFSGTSHTGPGVADTSPGSFSQQKWQRKVGIAAWARNIPGAAYAGAGEHIHGVSLLSPGARTQGQRDDYLRGGDGLGGSDYGPRPSLLPNLQELLKRFGPLISTLGGIGGPILPKWAQKIVNAPKKWAKGLLGNKLQGGGFKGTTQGLLDSLVAPSAKWAVDQLGAYSSAGGVPGGPMPGPAQMDKAGPELAKRFAYGRLKAFGFSKGQWPPLEKLWERESGWRWNADNPSSSAYGIPQSLPGSKMASAGANWRTNAGTQINWGLGYIKGRYGNPANAWGHSESHGWYDQGGLASGKGLIQKWTPKQERVLSPRQTLAFERWMDTGAADDRSGGSRDLYVTGLLDITPDGKAMIRGQARAEMGIQASHARVTARQRRGF